MSDNDTCDPDERGHLKVLEVLRRWDPKSVIDEQHEGEYDHYAVSFVELLERGCTVDHLTEWMRRIARNKLQVEFDEEHGRACAAELVAFWATLKTDEDDD